MLGLNPPSERHFAGVRIALGVYLAVHFASLVPYAGELFSSGGMLPDYDRLPSAGYFPNPLRSIGRDGATLAVILSVGLALLFAAGVYRRIVALGLWFAWASFFNRNPFIANPSIPYVGWLLLACAVIPDEAPLRPALPRAAQGWEVPRALYLGAWLLLGLGYTLSGLHKLGSPSWRDGTALRHVLELPLARDTSLRAAVLSLPDGAFATLTYGALFAELTALPLFAIRRLRAFAWWGLVAMQLGILCLLDFADLTLGMLLFHAFVFDSRWLSGMTGPGSLLRAMGASRNTARHAGARSGSLPLERRGLGAGNALGRLRGLGGRALELRRLTRDQLGRTRGLS